VNQSTELKYLRIFKSAVVWGTLYWEVPPEVGALGPQNKVMFATGPVAGNKHLPSLKRQSLRHMVIGEFR